MKAVKSYRCSRHRMSFHSEDEIEKHYRENHRKMPNQYRVEPVDMNLMKRAVWAFVWMRQDKFADMGKMNAYYCRTHRFFTYNKALMEKHQTEHENHPGEVIFPIPSKLIYWYQIWMKRIYENKSCFELM